MSVTAVCKNILRVFFLRERYSKLVVEVPNAGPAATRTMTTPVRKVGVLGAGVMGAGIAQWCSARGLTVRLKDIKPDPESRLAKGCKPMV